LKSTALKSESKFNINHTSGGRNARGLVLVTKLELNNFGYFSLNVKRLCICIHEESLESTSEDFEDLQQEGAHDRNSS